MVRQKMPPERRAKQFMPFDALKGFREALASKEKPRENKIIHGEDAEKELDMILNSIHDGEEVVVRYFFDESYAILRGAVAKNEKAKKYISIGETKIEYCDIEAIIIEKESPLSKV